LHWNLRAGRLVLPWDSGPAGENDMANRDVLAIGTSDGGVEALLFLAQRFSR
jgi:hypothetical protein